MENIGLYVVAILFLITVFLLGYRTGVRDGRQHNREIIDYLEKQLDKFFVPDNKDDRNDYWTRNHS